MQTQQQCRPILLLHRTRFEERKQMYGDNALKLVRELKRNKNKLVSYNTELVEAVLDETNQLYSEAQVITEQIAEFGQDPNHITRLTAIMSVIRRNKRCLLAYHHWRKVAIETAVRELRAEGAGQIPPPADLRDLLSPQERLYFKQYAAIAWKYKSNYEDIFDLYSQLHPPQSLYVRVRAVRDLTFETEEGGVCVMVRGHEDYVKRTEVQKFIEQGFLVHC